VGPARGLGFGGGWVVVVIVVVVVVVVIVIWEAHVSGCPVRDGAELVALFSQPAARVLVMEVGRPGGGNRVVGGLRASGAIAGGDPVDYGCTEEDWIAGVVSSQSAGRRWGTHCRCCSTSGTPSLARH
jgi:hypothetical protein